ncbi:MAG: hypothetical protein ABIZ81_11965 [Opitutaceae bacterium]
MLYPLDDKRKSGMQTTTGWFVVLLGILWALTVLIPSRRAVTNASETIGAVTVPILVALAGLYFAGVIKSAK